LEYYACVPITMNPETIQLRPAVLQELQ
jgi:hypothetical protein